MASVGKRKWTSPKGERKEAWVVRYKDRGGIHRSSTFDRKKDADNYARKVENEIEAGLHVARSETKKLCDVAAEFLKHVEGRAQEGQVGHSYVNLCSLSLSYIVPELGNIALVDLRWEQVETFGKRLRTTRSQVYGKPLAKRTIKNILDVLRTLVGYGVRRGYAARNVVPDALKELGPSRAPKIITFSRDEVRSIVKAIEDPNWSKHYRTRPKLRAMVYLAAVCGLRKGEIMALTWDHIDFAAGMIYIRQSLTDLDEIKPPKTVAGIRDVPMPPVVAAALEAWRPFVKCDERGLIMRNAKAGHHSDANFYRNHWHPLLERAGIEKTADRGWRHFHALRHFAGSSWLEAAIPLPEVSRLMGHAHAGITAQIYSHSIVEVSHRAGQIANCATNIMPMPMLPPASPITHGLLIAA